MTNKPRDFMPHESDNSYIAVEYRKLKAENDSLKAQLEIAVKACQLYEQAFDDTGNDYSHLVCLEEAQKLLEQIQKMLRKNEGDEQW